jgi:hypothetical protein
MIDSNISKIESYSFIDSFYAANLRIDDTFEIESSFISSFSLNSNI